MQYTKVKKLGAGAFGTVWLVDTAKGERLCMKEVSLKGLPPKEKRATMNEVSVLSKMSHEHIVSYKGTLPLATLLCLRAANPELVPPTSPDNSIAHGAR